MTAEDRTRRTSEADALCQQAYAEQGGPDSGVSLVAAGHYATETFGVRSLQGLAEGWGLETTWIDTPTGL